MYTYKAINNMHIQKMSRHPHIKKYIYFIHIRKKRSGSNNIGITKTERHANRTTTRTHFLVIIKWTIDALKAMKWLLFILLLFNSE